MNKTAAVMGLLAALTGTGIAQEGAVPKGIPHLDHVFVIMMENHGYGEILHNPNARFINQYAKKANLATNYFAVAHPSLTNYLETVADRTSACSATILRTGTTPAAPPISLPGFQTPTIHPAPPSARSLAAGPMPPPRPWTARMK